MTQQPQGPAEAADRATAAPAGRVRTFALVGAALSLVFYLLGFVSDVGTTDLVGALVIGGGLLAGVGALPRTGRLLAPAAVVVTVGMLVLLQVVASSRGGALLIGALVVAFLQTVAVVGALLMDTGVIGAPARRPKQPTEHAPYPAWSADQAWTQEHLGELPHAGAPGAGPAERTMAYGGQPGAADQAPYAGSPDNTAMIPASGAFPVGESSAVPVFGLAAAKAPERATEVVPIYGLSGAAPERGPSASGPSHAAPGDAPVYGLSGADAVNGAAAERGPSGPTHSAPADAPVPLYGLSGVGADGERGPSGPGHKGAAGAQAPRYGLAGEGGPSHSVQGDAPRYGLAGEGGQPHGAPGEAPQYGLSGAGAPGTMNGHASASGPSHAAPGEGPAAAFGPTARPGAERGPLYGLSGAPGVGGERGPSGQQVRGGSGEVPVPQYGPAGGGVERGPSGQAHDGEAQAQQYGLSGTGTPNAGPHAAPVYGPSGIAGPGAQHAGPVAAGDAVAPAPGSSSAPWAAAGPSGAHHAPTGETPQYGSPGTTGTGTSNAGAYRAGPVSGDSAVPTHGRPGPGSSNGRQAPSASGSHHTPAPGAAATPRAGTAPVGRDASGETAIPMYGLPGATPGLRPADASRGTSDPGSDTTAFPVQPARAESEATPAWGQTAAGGPDATMVATPGWLGAPDVSAEPSGPPPEPGSTGRAGRHGSSRRGRHGQPDNARPDATRVFPTPER